MWTKGCHCPPPELWGRTNEYIDSIKGDISTQEAQILFAKFLKANPSYAANLLTGYDLYPIQDIMLRSIFHRDYILGVCARGFSKSFSAAMFTVLYAIFNPGLKIGICSASFRQCLEENQQVMTQRGWVAIKDVEIGDSVISDDGSRNKITNKWKNEPAPLMTLVTDCGYRVTGKREHRVKVYCKYSGLYSYKELEEITREYIIPIQPAPIFDDNFERLKKRQSVFKNQINNLFGLNGNFEDVDGIDICCTSHLDDPHKNLRLHLLNLGIFSKSIGGLGNRIKLIKPHLHENGYFHDSVKSVYLEKSEGVTYDITVENNPSYNAQGFVNHNSKAIFEKIEEFANDKKGNFLKQCIVGNPQHSPDAYRMNIGSTQVVALPLGDGCLSLSTLVTYNNCVGTVGKNIPMDCDLAIDNQEFTSTNTQIWSNGEFRNSDQQFYNGIRPTKKIVTKKGFAIEATLNHKFKVCENNKIVWKEVGEMQEGDRILIDKSERWHDSDTDITTDMAYALGAIIGDGCLTNVYKIGFASKDIEIVQRVEKGLGVKFNNYLNDPSHFLIYNKRLRSKIIDLCDLTHENCRTIDKRIPDVIWKSSKEKLIAFLQGLFDTDGGIQAQTVKGGISISINFYNTSKILVSNVQFALLHFGIVSNITERKSRSKNWQPSSELHITGSAAKLFYEKIGFYLPRKQKILQEAVFNKQRWNDVSNQSVPVCKQYLSKQIREHKQTKPGNGHFGPASILSRETISKQTIKRIGDHYDYDWARELVELTQDHIYYDSVKLIVDSECPTADLHVPDGHEYCANGFFSHNSKIRGYRFNVMIVDELLLLSEKIIQEVIQPFMAIEADVRDRGKIREAEDKLIAAGKITEADRYHFSNNKFIGLTTASFEFEFLYKLYSGYKASIVDPNITSVSHALFQLSHEAAPKGMYKASFIDNMRKTSSAAQFAREMEAQFTGDSAGYFSAKKMHERTVPPGEEPHIELTGDNDSDYVLAIDPNYNDSESSDHFAMCLLKLDRENQSGTVVHNYALSKSSLKNRATYLKYLFKHFNIVYVILDAAGGKKFVQDVEELGDLIRENQQHLLLMDHNLDNANWDEGVIKTRPEFRPELGKICHAQVFGSNWIRMANEHLAVSIEQGKIWFASSVDAYSESFFQNCMHAKIGIDDLEFDSDYKTDKKANPVLVSNQKQSDFIEHQNLLMKLTKDECSLITVTQNSQGGQRFDLPPELLKDKNKPDRARKDSYSALLLAAWGMKCYFSLLTIAPKKFSGFKAFFAK